jgi:hypothetical protein
LIVLLRSVSAALARMVGHAGYKVEAYRPVSRDAFLAASSRAVAQLSPMMLLRACADHRTNCFVAGRAGATGDRCRRSKPTPGGGARMQDFQPGRMFENRVNYPFLLITIRLQLLDPPIAGMSTLHGIVSERNNQC